MNKIENQTLNIDLDKLVNKLTTMDSISRKSVKFVKILYLTLFPLIVFRLVVNIIEKDISQIFSTACTSIAFLIIIWVSSSTYKKHKTVDFSLPTVELLRKYSKKIRLGDFKFAIGILLGLTIMDIGIVNTSLPYNIPIFKFQLFYWGFIAIVIVIGIIVWYIKYKPLRIDIRRVLKEIEE